MRRSQLLRQGEGPAGRGLAGLCRAAPGCGPPGRSDRGDAAASGGGPGQDRQNGPAQALHRGFHPCQHGDRRGRGYAGGCGAEGHRNPCYPRRHSGKAGSLRAGRTEKGKENHKPSAHPGGQFPRHRSAGGPAIPPADRRMGAAAGRGRTGDAGPGGLHGRHRRPGPRSGPGLSAGLRLEGPVPLGPGDHRPLPPVRRRCHREQEGLFLRESGLPLRPLERQQVLLRQKEAADKIRRRLAAEGGPGEAHRLLVRENRQDL